MDTILGNIFSTIGAIIDFVAGIKYKEKKKILQSNFISSFCSLLAMICLGSVSGIINVCVTLIRLFTIYKKDEKNLNLHRMFLFFVIIYATVFFDYDGIYTWLLFLSSMCSFIPKWYCKNTQILRIGGLNANLLIIGYNIHIQNYASIFFNIFNIIGILIGLIKWFYKDKKEKICQK